MHKRRSKSIRSNTIKNQSKNRTEPIHSICPAPYLNQLCKAKTDFSFNLTNEVLKEIEKRQGRTHNEDGIVTIDLDLLQYDDELLHIRDWERDYVKNLISEL